MLDQITSRLRAETDGNRLRNSITYNVSNNVVEVGTEVEYAAVHRFGASAARKTRIPARPFLGIEEESREKLYTLVKNFLQGAPYA